MGIEFLLKFNAHCFYWLSLKKFGLFQYHLTHHPHTIRTKVDKIDAQCYVLQINLLVKMSIAWMQLFLINLPPGEVSNDNICV